MNTRVTIPEYPSDAGGGRLGRSVNHDPRSLSYRVTPQPARALASVRHDRQVPVFDQGQIGSCTGQASVGAVGTLPLFPALPAGHAALDETEALMIYSAATSLDDVPGTYPPDDTGSSGLAAAKACLAAGLIPGYLHATDLATMQTALQDTPVIVGINWYSSFDRPDSSGQVTISPNAQVRGGHEFEVIGLDVTGQTFLAVNSWSDAWGVKGYFQFSFDTMARLLAEQGDCTQLLPLTVPAPVPTPAPTPDPVPVPAPTPSPVDPAVLAWWEASRKWAHARHAAGNLVQAKRDLALAKALGLS